MIEPVRIGDATLYCADCRDVLPTLGRVDAVVTDPPYGASKWNDRKARARRTKFHAAEFEAWDRAPDETLLLSVINAGRVSIVFGCNHFMGLLPPTKKLLIWDKSFRGLHFNDCEVAASYGCGEACRVFVHQPLEEKQHPTQKPVEVMRWCIGHLPDDALTILDPFAGSGTTGVAAVKMGRKFIGIEREPQYFDVMCRRIRDAYAQPDMFVPRPAAPQQEAML